MSIFTELGDGINEFDDLVDDFFEDYEVEDRMTILTVVYEAQAATALSLMEDPQKAELFLNKVLKEMKVRIMNAVYYVDAKYPRDEP
jgi:hypothetical protein